MVSLAIYVLTYNAPEQFQLWCESFIQSKFHSSLATNLYVINNSDSIDTFAHYNSLFEQYGFQSIHEGQNLGINGGRYLAACHFDKTICEYMIFFEDDMLLRDSNLDFCKSGFKTYHPYLFEDAINILKNEQIHFLKICFTEVFGNNYDNWAINSLKESDKIEIFKRDPEGFFLSSTVNIDHINSYNGLAYAIGAFHYCNWPILFTKEGNRQIFIEFPIKEKCELAWTRLAYLLTLMGNLKVGCLLASPIKHLRKHIYDPNCRIENENGLKIPGVTICLATN